MNILLVGYGKMGKAVEAAALKRGHSIAGRIDAANREDLARAESFGADVAIEFSTPESALKNVSATLSKGIPTVSGTTAWLAQIPEAQKICKEHGTAFLHASNFSLGVNLFFSLNKKMAELMKEYPEYACSMTEIHHTQKLDAPSGTAVRAALDILPILGKEKWVLGKSSAQNEIGIVAAREENVPGTHYVRYESEIDFIEIIHEAKSRDGFAQGAVIAAEWLVGKKGFFTMNDVLGL